MVCISPQVNVPAHACIHISMCMCMCMCKICVPYIACAMDINVLLWATYCLLCLSLQGCSVYVGDHVQV